MENVYLISACRTAVGSFGGTLKDISATKLGEIVIKEAATRAGIDLKDIDEVIMGNVLQAGLGQNPARQAAVNAGVPVESPAFTINKVCGSGLKAVSLGYAAIVLGDAKCVAAGGMENMSQAPYLLKQQRWGAKMGNVKVEDSMITEGLWDAFNDYHMGITAENIAEQYCISREQQDAFALSSQTKAGVARGEGKFKNEIVPVEIPQRRGEPIVFDTDEHIRETTIEKLGKLSPAFKKDGTVTAGNASGINDGAACILLASDTFVKANNIKPIAKIIGRGSMGVNPSVMGLGPVPSVKKALENAQLKMDDIELIEANEAFAVQALGVMKDLELEANIVNVNGGAIAIGHPIGASGARILVTLLAEMDKRDAEYGLATLCIGGGMGEALIVQRDALCK